MPRRLMDNLECEVIDEEFHKRALWHDILSADLNGEDALLLNICEYCAFGVISYKGKITIQNEYATFYIDKYSGYDYCIHGIEILKGAREHFLYAVPARLSLSGGQPGGGRRNDGRDPAGDIVPSISRYSARQPRRKIK